MKKLFSIFAVLLIACASCTKPKSDMRLTPPIDSTDSLHMATVLTGTWVIVNHYNANAYDGVEMAFYDNYCVPAASIRPNSLYTYVLSGDTITTQSIYEPSPTGRGLLHENDSLYLNYCKFKVAGDTLYLHSFTAADSITLAKVY